MELVRDITELRDERGRVVDIFPYVAKESIVESTAVGVISTCRGWLSNGAGTMAGDIIFDLCPEAFITHDRGYVYPVVRGKRYTKIQWDLAYGSILRNHKAQINPVIRNVSWWVRPLVLIAKGHEAWNSCRTKENQYGLAKVVEMHMVPKAHVWEFPTWRTKDAVLDEAA